MSALCVYSLRIAFLVLSQNFVRNGVNSIPYSPRVLPGKNSPLRVLPVPISV
nr:MAG TPA: hypothetical protein [Caudoviricetes sp.]